MRNPMRKKTLDDVDVTGKRVLVRVDFNVPLEGDRITDDTRIRAASAHHPAPDRRAGAGGADEPPGRPDGMVKDDLRLAPVAERLAQLLGRPVATAPDCTGPKPRKPSRPQGRRRAAAGEPRFHPQEEANDPEFARQLASLGDVYVNDAFGTAHRAHASTEGVAHLLPAVAGDLMEKELSIMGRALVRPQRPFAAIVGEEGLGQDRRLEQPHPARRPPPDRGAMANTFLKAHGLEIGRSYYEEEALDTARAWCARRRRRIKSCCSRVTPSSPPPWSPAPPPRGGGQRRAIGHADRGHRAPDGPAYAEASAGARTVIWNGPMGVFEIPFDAGTRQIAEALTSGETGRPSSAEGTRSPPSRKRGWRSG